MRTGLALLLALCQVFLHVAKRLPEKLLRFLDAIQHGMKVGFEESRDSVYQCH
jgi:hypothetical protein